MGGTRLFRVVGTDSLDLGALFSASPNAYVIFDPQLTIVGCNEAYLAVVGRQDSEEIVGRHVFDAFPSPAESPSHALLRGSLDKVLETRERDHIAVIPYDTSEPGQRPNMRYWSATHTPIFDRNGDFRYILQHTVDISELQMLRERDARGSMAEAGVLQRAIEIQAANFAIRAESQLLRDMFKQAPGFIGILAGPDHSFVLANDAYQKLVGGRDLVGLSVAQALPEIVGQGFIDLLDQVYRSGEPYVGRNVAVVLNQPGKSAPEQRYLDFIYQPIFAEDGKVTGIFVQGSDVTHRVEAERLQLLQQHELGHRLKNQLAMVQAIATQTLRSAGDLPSAAKTISTRLRALAAAHDSLIAGESRGTSVGKLVQGIMRIHDDSSVGRFHVEGPETAIGSRPALSLSLILNELSTNAVKYGALSVPEGAVSLSWGVHEVKGEPRFLLVWRESGGPLVTPPPKTGVGTGLIKAGLAGTTGGEVSVSYDPAGLVCEISVGPEELTREA